MHSSPKDTAAIAAYSVRLRRVLAHIEARADGDLSVEALSRVAAFSKFHFHRQFTQLLGMGVYEYVKLVRLRRASFQLAFRDHQIVEVALASGYESHEAFSRAFKKTFGQTPSEFRQAPAWTHWLSTYRQITQLRSENMKRKDEYQSEDVSIVDFGQTRVAALEHRGDPRTLMDSVRKFIAWRKENGLPPRLSATYNILYDDLHTTPSADYRFDVCAAITGKVADNAYGVVEKTIPAGRCAVLRHVGADDGLDAAVSYLYGTWLPSSGQELRDFPLYLQRVRFFPDVPEHEAVSDLFLPLA